MTMANLVSNCEQNQCRGRCYQHDRDDEMMKLAILTCAEKPEA